MSGTILRNSRESQAVKRVGPLMVMGTLTVLLGFAIFLPGFLLLCVFLLLIAGDGALSMWGDGQTIVLQATAAIIAVAVGRALIHKGGALRLDATKMKTIDGWTLLAEDQRPPVIYFRSFVDDETTDERLEPNNMPAADGMRSLVFALNALIGAAPGAHTTVEEQLVRRLRSRGPFVALGIPGEQLPVLGAARIYPNAHEWRETVAYLMDRADLLIFRVGLSSGLWWEIDQALRAVGPEQILFWLPSTNDNRNTHQYEAFAARLQERVPCRLPPWERGRIFLWFEAEWRAAHLGKLRELPSRYTTPAT